MQSPIGPEDYRQLLESLPDLVAVLSPDGTIVAATDAYVSAAKLPRRSVVRADVFTVFPGGLDDLNAPAAAELRGSLDRVASLGCQDAVRVRKFEPTTPIGGNGEYAARDWIVINKPVMRDGRIAYIIHRVEEATEAVAIQPEPRSRKQGPFDLPRKDVSGGLSSGQAEWIGFADPRTGRASNFDPTRAVRHAGELVDEIAAALPAGPSAARLTPADSPLILVVDDNPAMGRYLESVIGRHYKVVTAPDIDQGLRLAQELSPYLIVTDLNTPETGRKPFVADVRAWPALDHTPIVVLTSKSDDQLRVQLIRTGIQDYVDKPFSADELMARIDRLVEDRRDSEQIIAGIEVWRHSFLRDVLFSVTEGKLRVCSARSDLPVLGRLARAVDLTAETVRTLRGAIRDAAKQCEFQLDRIEDFSTAASEAAMNAIVHAEGGTARVCIGEDGELQVCIDDYGRGIDLSSLPRAALEKGFSTAGTLGFGFFLMLNFVDRLHLYTGLDGTVVVLEMVRQTPEPIWLRQETAMMPA
jgi:CheY-like chemotaxis protein/anti-sigma regulatory factor (Ser/Thr protein kinase)